MSKQQLFINRTGYIMARGAERTPGAYVNRGDGLPPGYVAYDAIAPAPVAHTSAPGAARPPTGCRHCSASWST